MKTVDNTNSEKAFWSLRYEESRTGWDLGAPSIPLQTYIDQLANKELKILIPGAGNAYEAAYLYENGFTNVHILDISPIPLQQFGERYPDFPKGQLIEGNFFEHKGTYDLIFEQTFFCAFPPTIENRTAYGVKMSKLLNPKGKLVGLWFKHPLTGDMVKRPFGGNRAEYLSYLSPYFKIQVFEDCHNSIKPRMGNELFGIFVKK